MVSTLVTLLIGLLVLGLILWVVRFAVGALGLPPIIVQVATVIIAIIAILWLVQLLLGGVGGLDVPLGRIDVD